MPGNATGSMGWYAHHMPIWRSGLGRYDVRIDALLSIFEEAEIPT